MSEQTSQELKVLLVGQIKEYIPDIKPDSFSAEKLIAILIICRCRHSYWHQLHGAYIPQENTAITFKSNKIKGELLCQLKNNNCACIFDTYMSGTVDLIQNVFSGSDYHVLLKDAKDIFTDGYGYCDVNLEKILGKLLYTEAEHFFADANIPVSLFQGLTYRDKINIIQQKHVIIIKNFSGEISDIGSLLRYTTEHVKIIVILKKIPQIL